MKHAFLISCHNYNLVLETLIKQIDNTDCDIFIHVDKKCKNFPFNKIVNLVNLSNIHFTKRILVNWGSFSQIKVELLLLETAIEKHIYKYFHLLSGQDLLLKNINNVIEFFNSHYPTEFVDLKETDDDILNRIKYYYFYNERDKGFKKCIRNYLLAFQFKIGFKRVVNIPIKKGSNWFSITDQFATYLLNKKALINKLFSHSLCGDEIFLCSILFSSPYYKNLYKVNKYSNLRFICWNKNSCSPVVLTKELIKKCKIDCLFARKFDTQDVDTINYVFFKTNNTSIFLKDKN